MNEIVKKAICRVSAYGATTTGYLVAPTLVATSLDNGVGARDIEVAVSGRTYKGLVVKDDARNDIAIVELITSGEGGSPLAPLPVAIDFDARAEFVGYSHADTSYAPHTFSGLVLDPAAIDDNGQRVFKLYCDAARNSASLPQPGSPLIVDGAVIGHWRGPLGAGDASLYGVGFATPVSAVRSLGIDTKNKTITVESLVAPKPNIPALPVGHYHVFLSYRSTDRAVASELAELLEGAGLRVFLDQKELQPGDALATSLEKGLANSRAGVVLASRGWLDSPWCQKEADVLKQRSVEQEGFTLVPLRLDDSELPPFLGSLVWLDFTREQRGEKVQELIRALSGSASSTQGAVSPIEAAELRIIGAFQTEVRAASTWDQVMRVAEDWQQYNSTDRTVLIQAAERLIGQNHSKEALLLLDKAGGGLRARQLKGLALDKTGQTDEALRVLNRLYEEGHRDPETTGILAAMYKRLAQKTKNPAARGRALELYVEGWQTTGDTYNGINAAHLTLLSGDREGAQRLARQLLAVLEQQNEAELGHWELATVAEAHLISQDLPMAEKWYRKAAAKKPHLIQDISVMRSQARNNLEALGERREALDDALFVPRVMAFAGHMEDAKGRRHLRFPSGKVGQVRQALAERFEKLGQVYAFCSAARGSDLLFLDELIKRGGYAKVVLPFRREDYKRISVGGDWDKKFDELVDNPRVDLVAPGEPAPETNEERQKAFAETNRRIYGEASKFAKGLGQEPQMLAVWDKKKGDGPGGTADAVSFWQQEENNPVEVIDIRRVGTRMIADPRRLAVGAVAVVALVTVFSFVGWQTDLIAPARQARGVSLVSEEVRRSMTFDVNDSAGLFVGIREFDNFPLVPYAVDDAVDLAHLFSVELQLIKPENVVMALAGKPQKLSSRKRLGRLTSSGAETVTPNHIEMLKQIRQVPTKAGKDGLLVFAFASHGFAHLGNHYLVTSDTVRQDIVGSAIAVSKLLDNSSLAKVRRSALFLDACQERVAARGEGEGATQALYDALGGASGIAILAGTQLGGYSYDDDKEQNGVFTNAVIEGLGGGAKADGDFITVRTLGDYVHEEVKNWVAVNRPGHQDVSLGIERRILGDAATLPLASVQAASESSP